MSDSTTSQVQQASPIARDLSSTTIILIATIGFAILCAILILSWLFLRERRNHKRIMTDLEQRGVDIALVPPQAVQRPRNVLRRSTFLPFGTRTGWDNLASREDVSQRPPKIVVPNHNFTRASARGGKRRRSGTAAGNMNSWLISRRWSTVPLTSAVPSDAMRLSAIVESPLVPPSSTTPIVRHDSEPLLPPRRPSRDGTSELVVMNKTIRRIDSLLALRPDPLAVTKKRNRAQTMDGGALPALVLAPRSESKVTKRSRPSMHARSFSLGSQSPGSAPQNPAPPLPLSIKGVDGVGRPRSCVEGNMSSRISISSLESISSSVLASPKLQRSVSERSARLQTGARRNYVNSLIAGPRPQQPRVGKRPQSSPDHNLALQSLQGSIRSNPDSMQSMDESRTYRPRSGIFNGTSLLSVRSGVAIAEVVRMSRVSVSSNSPGGLNIVTPRRQSRLVITPNGSPAHRKCSIALKEIHGNAHLSRQLSQTSTSASSTRSSNGNPFQFDPSPMASGKPSALKGSPNARNRGHKRQNCVRISLSPTIINAQKRGSSPLMADIAEESPENSAKLRPKSIFSSSMGPLPQPPSSPHPPSTDTFAPELKLGPTSLRASLTPSSPTLSSMRYSQDLSSAHDYSNISLASSAQAGKEAKRYSASSVGTIPAFPSPGKVAITTTTNIQPTPIFSYTRPSNELERESSPPESFTFLAKPFSPLITGQGPKVATKEVGDQLKALSSSHSPPEQFIFFQMEKEHLKASGPPFETLQILERTPSPSFEPQDWSSLSEATESLPLLSRPCSPKTTLLSPTLLNERLPSSPPVAEPDMEKTLPLHSPSPIPGLKNQNSSLLSPPAQLEPPDSNLCLSIARLRRMNSDANDDAKDQRLRAARRYQRLGNREGSPQFGQCLDALCSRESMNSLSEIDRALEEGIGLEGLDGELDEDASILPREGEMDDGALLLKNIAYNKENDEERDTKSAKRSSKIWNSGEEYWTSRSRSSSPLPSPLSDASKNQINRNSGSVQSLLVHRRVSEMRSSLLAKLPEALSGFETPQIAVQPPRSDRATPGSLYDENGFLK